MFAAQSPNNLGNVVWNQDNAANDLASVLLCIIMFQIEPYPHLSKYLISILFVNIVTLVALTQCFDSVNVTSPAVKVTARLPIHLDILQRMNHAARSDAT